MKVSLRKIYALALRRLREFRGWSQAELGDRMGFTKSTVSKIETGKQSLTSDDLDAFLEVVEVDLSVFHELCRSIQFELETLDGEGRSRTAGVPKPHSPSSPTPPVPLIRQALGPLPGSDLQVRLAVWLESRPEPEEGVVRLPRKV